MRRLLFFASAVVGLASYLTASAQGTAGFGSLAGPVLT